MGGELAWGDEDGRLYSVVPASLLANKKLNERECVLRELWKPFRTIDQVFAHKNLLCGPYAEVASM